MLQKILFVALLFSLPAAHVLNGQDAPSLGETARRIRAERHTNAAPTPSPAPSDIQPAPAPTPSSAATPAPAASPTSAATPVVVATPTPANSQNVTQSVRNDSTGPRAKTEVAAKADGDVNLHFLEHYQEGIRNLLEQEKFAAIDSAAHAARSARARFPGGFWTIHTIYGPLTRPAKGTYEATEADWTAHLERLQRWVAQRPQSITARVALAGAYLQYGWKARGGGSASEVTEQGWELFRVRLDMAAQTLVKAYELPAKCPEWFLTMQMLARDQGRGRDHQTAILQKAIAFEPDYQYFYRAHAEYLLPKWDGEEGEMAAFAEQIADRIGGEKGDMIYYQIGTHVNCACDNKSQLNGMSWPRIKRGYIALEKQYGVSLANINSVCSLAAMAGDAAFTQELLARIGETWDPTVWRDKKAFDDVRTWADVAAAQKPTLQTQR